MKEYTEKELTLKAEAYCAAAERCPADVQAKLCQWGSDEPTAAAVMAHLFQERYLDESRYCVAFVRDKYRFNQWGRLKIVQALRMKRLPDEAIDTGLQEINEEEYTGLLRQLLRQKEKSIRTANDYERRAKLMRYAAGKGFTVDEIQQCLRHLDADEFME
ncbi:MAG: RecX family transcriptional regulator [Phocaeicola plebeius]|nr:RecX family transcriptional regulator [Phocaeicola plebeius]